MPFSCSICGEESTRICARCTKDACSNHLCEKCRCCSDCCECEVVLNEPLREPARSAFRLNNHLAQHPVPSPEPEPQAPEPPPGPDPLPPEDPEPGPIVP